MKPRFWIAFVLVSCATEGSDPICGACEPESIGDTGDLGGEYTWCWGMRVPEMVDAARARELGFDVEALESAIARPIDMALGWQAHDVGPFGEPARGYSQANTRITARVQSLGSYRHMRVDPRYCDGTTCRVDGVVTAQQASCARTLEVNVRVAFRTADGAASGVLTGYAMQVIAGTGSEGEGEGLAESSALVEVSAPLSQVEGTLRLFPRPGAQEYRTAFRLSVRLGRDDTSGSLFPKVHIVETENLGADYYPLSGSFPPVDDGN